MAQKKLANRHMVAEIGTMLAKGGIDYSLALALIEGRVEIVERPREQKGKPYRGDVAGTSNEHEPNRYRLYVSYAKLPGFEELFKKFFEDGVSELYDGRPWVRHSSCANIDETPGEREFLVAEVPEEFLGKSIRDCWDDLEAYFGKTGFRFAIETEAFEFSDAQPDLQRKNPILALGSSALLDDVTERFVTVLEAHRISHHRIQYGQCVDNNLISNFRLLLARNVS